MGEQEQTEMRPGWWQVNTRYYSWCLLMMGSNCFSSSGDTLFTSLLPACFYLVAQFVGVLMPRRRAPTPRFPVSPSSSGGIRSEQKWPGGVGRDVCGSVPGWTCQPCVHSTRSSPSGEANVTGFRFTCARICVAFFEGNRLILFYPGQLLNTLSRRQETVPCSSAPLDGCSVLDHLLFLDRAAERGEQRLPPRRHRWREQRPRRRHPPAYRPRSHSSVGTPHAAGVGTLTALEHNGHPTVAGDARTPRCRWRAASPFPSVAHARRTSWQMMHNASQTHLDYCH